MRKIGVLMCLLSASFGAHGAGWEGNLVKVKKGALLCDFASMKAALLLQKSGDTASIQVLIDKALLSNRAKRVRRHGCGGCFYVYRP
jgi:hypothetical protein